jgi:hypothetical protein
MGSALAREDNPFLDHYPARRKRVTHLEIEPSSASLSNSLVRALLSCVGPIAPEPALILHGSDGEDAVLC